MDPVSFTGLEFVHRVLCSTESGSSIVLVKSVLIYSLGKIVCQMFILMNYGVLNLVLIVPSCGWIQKITKPIVC